MFCLLSKKLKHNQQLFGTFLDQLPAYFLCWATATSACCESKIFTSTEPKAANSWANWNRNQILQWFYLNVDQSQHWQRKRWTNQKSKQLHVTCQRREKNTRVQVDTRDWFSVFSLSVENVRFFSQFRESSANLKWYPHYRQSSNALRIGSPRKRSQVTPTLA